MATGTGPTSPETYGNGGTNAVRLKFTETWDDDLNTSDLKVEFQIRSTYTGTGWTAYGAITVDETSIVADGNTFNKKTSSSSSYETVKTVTLTNLTHNDDGTLSVMLKVSGRSGNNFYARHTGFSLNTTAMTNTSGYPIVLHTNDSGGKIYIDNDLYEVRIGNGTAWESYKVYFGNGTEFTQ